MDKTTYGALFACKFKNEHIQFAFVTSTQIYRLAIEIFDNAHEMWRIKQMRNKPEQILRYLSAQPLFDWYSNEPMHIPGVNVFLSNDGILFDELRVQKTINVGTSMPLEYIAKVNAGDLCISTGAKLW